MEVGNIPTLTDTCSKDMSKLLTMMHGRQRSEHRSKISASVAARERLLQEGKLGKVIKSIMGTEKERFDYGVLSTADGIITDPTQIHNKVASHFQDWFAGPASDHGGIHAATTDWKTVFSDREAFFEHGRRRAVPEELTSLVWEAIQQPSTETGFGPLKEQLEEQLRHAPTFDEFCESIKMASVGSAAGLTGASYNMLKTAPEHVLRDIYDILSRLWTTKHVPDWWQWRILAAMPKIPGSNDLDHLRPLMLAECLRKVWTVIPLRKIQAAWEKHNILASEQHGFRPGRGTESAILQVLNMLTAAHDSGSPLFSTFWDITRAFGRLCQQEHTQGGMDSARGTC